MFKSREVIDSTDRRIIEILQNNCKLSLSQVARDLNVPKATLHYRIRKLEKRGIIEGYHAKIDASKVGKDFHTITFVRAKYGPNYHKKLGKRLTQIPGVLEVYFLFGEIDFVVVAVSDNSKDFLRKIEEMQKIPEIVSTNTHIVAQVIKGHGTVAFDVPLKNTVFPDSS